MLDKVDPTFREWVLARGGSWYTGDAWTQTGLVIRFKLPNINLVPLPRSGVVAKDLLFTYHTQKIFGMPAVCWGWVNTIHVGYSPYSIWLPHMKSYSAWKPIDPGVNFDLIFGIALSKDSGYNTVHYRLSLDLHEI